MQTTQRLSTRCRFPLVSRCFASNTASMAPSQKEATVKESVIRKMTRLANEFKAVNLSQGYPNEAPPWKVRLALAHGVLAGTTDFNSDDSEEGLQESIIAMLQQPQTDDNDVINQYSPPMGRADVRNAISKYYERLYDYNVSPDDITVTLGATEAFASALRTIGRPGDKSVIFEPFHEIYPSQCKIFYLEPSYVTLRPDADNIWTFNESELEEALSEARILVLNTPHNPTGKVFTFKELELVANLCWKHNVYILTDEIYEFMCYGDSRHIIIPKEFPKVADRTLICNSMGKSGSATGWRFGWCIHPPHLTDVYRGVHDQMVVMSPHPMQYASLTYLSLPDSYFGQELATRYKDRLDRLANKLTEVGFDVVMPEGAHYLFVNYRSVPTLKDMKPMDAAMHMVKNVGVACVPGDNFYGKALGEGQKYLRFAACRSTGDIIEACKRLDQL